MRYELQKFAGAIFLLIMIVFLVILVFLPDRNWDRFESLIKIIVWPLFISFLVIIFYKECAALINRIKKITGVGFELDAYGQRQLTESSKQDSLNQLENDLGEHKKIINSLFDLQSRTDQGKRTFEAAYLIEKTYRLIFGSQLSMLTVFEAQPDKTLSKSFMYNLYLGTSFVGSYPFEQYINFLVVSKLIKKSTDITFKLTEFGSVFLQYLRNNNIPLRKPL